MSCLFCISIHVHLTYTKLACPGTHSVYCRTQLVIFDFLISVSTSIEQVKPHCFMYQKHFSNEQITDYYLNEPIADN